MNRTRIVAAAAIAAALLLAPSAHADQVSTKDGSTFQGELVERVKGDHITLKLATGEVKTFRWTDIDFSSATPQVGAGAGQVILESDRENTTLMRLASAGTGYGSVGGRGVAVSFENYEPVCTAPCRAAADPNATYVVAGEGVTPSPKFRLPRDPEVSLRIHGGSAAKRGWGAVSIYGGASLALVGGTFFLLGSLMEPNPNDSLYTSSYATDSLQKDKDRASTWRTLGVIGLGSGIALLALGISLVVTSGTDVFTPSGQIAKRSPSSSPALKFTPTGLVF